MPTPTAGDVAHGPQPAEEAARRADEAEDAARAGHLGQRADRPARRHPALLQAACLERFL